MAEISLSAICNRFHTVRERLCRWLLAARDRARLDSFSLTQELLSEMIGSRRQGISEAISSLQKSDMISYERGRLTIVSAENLRAAACECYGLAKQAYDEYLRLDATPLYRTMSATGQTRLSSQS